MFVAEVEFGVGLMDKGVSNAHGICIVDDDYSRVYEGWVGLQLGDEWWV